jgi:hypothetical protein
MFLTPCPVLYLAIMGKLKLFILKHVIMLFVTVRELPSITGRSFGNLSVEEIKHDCSKW